ncbi:hypothetical protein B0H67DRAFT_587140 [Lasiosphaeris hirsuta]|uniref:Uncharacterized protein n=1 Tax=Lasiosphaeris hirsuta TaxID=260670 RepID=A0AA40A0X3_9PEZI|nr:hypothetical protein B0H67DRAFT_587140 [Lasiosphaeris hirsuta]
MSSSKPLRFINIVHPEIPGHLAEHRSSIHRHAARDTHARRRKRAPGGQTTAQHENVDVGPLVRLTTNSPAGLVQINALAGLPNSMTRREHFLLNHYVAAVIPYVRSKCTKLSARGPLYVESMDQEWVGLALQDKGFRNAVLLKSSRHLALVHSQGRQSQVFFAGLATSYKLLCVRALGEVISRDRGSSTLCFSDAVVAQTLELAHDEIALGDWATGCKHVRGAVRMVELNGGTHTLGLNGFLEAVLYKSMGEVGLLMQPLEAPSAVNLFMSVP